MKLPYFLPLTFFLPIPLSFGASDASTDENSSFLNERRVKWVEAYTPSSPWVEKDKAGILRPSHPSMDAFIGDEYPLIPEHIYIGSAHTPPVSSKRRREAESETNEESVVQTYTSPDGVINYINRNGTRKKRIHNETFARTRKKTCANGRKYPFPPYQAPYIDSSGTLIYFDRGHGIDQADTNESSGMPSSVDKENLTPQNRYYNQRIRNPLVGEIRSEGGSYKEIAIYGNDNITIAEGKERVRLPLGFVFLEFKDHKISRAYYFPNLIDYSVLPEHNIKPKKWKKFAEKFEIDITTYWHGVGPFRPTIVGRDSADAHLRKKYGCLSNAMRILVGNHLVLQNDNEGYYVPAEACTALLKEIVVNLIETSAELEFETIESQIAAAATFASHSKYGELAKSSLYNLAKARKWMERAEKQTAGNSTIEEKLRLLGAYQDNDLKQFSSFGKIKALEARLIEQATSKSNLDEQMHIIEYFGHTTPEGQEWVNKMLSRLQTKSTGEEKLEIFYWLLWKGGYKIPEACTIYEKECLEKALEIYTALPPSERKRIEDCCLKARTRLTTPI